MCLVLRKIRDEVLDRSGETMNPKSDLRDHEASLYTLCISIFQDYDSEVLPGICRDFVLKGVFLLHPFPCLKSPLLGPVHQWCPLGQHHMKASFQHPPVIQSPAWAPLPEVNTLPFCLLPSFDFWLCNLFSYLWHISPMWTQHCLFSFLLWFSLSPPSFTYKTPWLTHHSL